MRALARSNAQEIADSLKRASTRNIRRTSPPSLSARSMAKFLIDRVRGNLATSGKSALERAKKRLCEAFGREP
ncbi:DUF3175 domain-containing protein [Caballeronia pedi]|uniref:DUF3175 domain-containing protein n=1 Tax=Caballeronia pedi TaxID=1777141 RepID=UPI000A428A2E|nr:DUF3175 domain-containing protein [Caballeronia pedi]